MKIKLLNKKEFTLNRSRGFTLIELMVVMAIIAVLAVLITGAITIARRTSIETQNRGNAKTIEAGLEAFAARNSGIFCKDTGGIGDPTDTPACIDQPLWNVYEALQPTYQQPYSLIGPCHPSNMGGGGRINLTSTTFTISISDYTCGSNYIGTITH